MNDKLRVKNNELGGKMKYRYRTDDEMKDSGVKYLDKIPKQWGVVRNKYIFEEINKKSEGENTDLLSVSEYYGVALRKDKMSEDEFLTRAETLEGYKCCERNDLVMNIMLAWKKAMGISEYNGIVSPAYCVYRQLYNNINPKYYHYLFRTDLYATIFKQNSTGIIDSRLRLYPEKFFGIYSYDVSKIEQNRIVKFLDEKTAQFDSIISKKEALIEKLDEAKKSLISEVVTGKVRVVKTDDGYELVERTKEEMKDSGVEWLGDIPIEWDISKLKYIGESITGLTYSPKDIVDENKGILVLRSSNVQNGKIVFEDNVYVDMNIPDKLITKIGDIIICSRNGSRALIGKNACIREEQQGMSFGAFMTIFRSRYFEYLNFVFNSEIFKAQSGSFLTSTINQLTISNLNSFIIPLPNFKEQNIVVMYLREKISEYDKILDNIKMQIEKLKEAKQSLISEAVTGKIEILD